MLHEGFRPHQLNKVLSFGRSDAQSQGQIDAASGRATVGMLMWRLTNLRFADDILLVTRSLPQIKEIIADVDMVHEVVKKLNGYKLIKMVKIENEDNVFRLYLK